MLTFLFFKVYQYQFEIALIKDKQYIVSVNEYHLQKDNEQLMDLVHERTQLELSEDSLL